MTKLPATTVCPLSRRRLLGASAAALAGAVLPRPVAAAATVAPRRIVTVGADITETVAALDGFGRLVAVDSGSRRPAEVARLASVGFFRTLSAEGILALDPDLVVATDMIGPPDAVAQLRSAGVRIETVREPDTIAGIHAKVGRIAALLGREGEGGALTGRIDAAVADLDRRLAGISRRPKVLVVMAIDGGAPLAVGNVASINAAIALAGGDNAGLSWTSVKPVSREVLVAAPPDLVLTTPEIWARVRDGAGFLNAIHLAGHSDLTADRVMAVDAGPFFFFGPSTPEIARDVAMRLHPERFGRHGRHASDAREGHDR